MTPLQLDWARCRGWIRSAIEPTGLYQVEDVEKAIAAGDMHFWPGRNCAAVTEFVVYPNCKVLNIYAGGGVKGRALRELAGEMEPAFEAWARAAGCKKIIGFGIKSAWKPVCEKMGYRHLWTVMAKDVE